MSEKIQPTDPKIATAFEIIDEARRFLGSTVDRKLPYNINNAQRYVEQGFEGSEEELNAFCSLADLNKRKANRESNFDRVEEIEELKRSLL